MFRARVLSEDERAELVAWWRQEFDKAQAPGFTFCAGPGNFVKGADARREHYRWADVPLELVKEWTTQRRRQNRTIRRRSVMTTIRTAAVTLSLHASAHDEEAPAIGNEGKAIEHGVLKPNTYGLPHTEAGVSAYTKSQSGT